MIRDNIKNLINIFKDKFDIFLAILQAISTSGGIYWNFTDKFWSLQISFVLQLVILFVLLLKAILPIQKGIIKYSLKQNGYLCDSIAGYRNTSLRTETLSIILECLNNCIEYSKREIDSILRMCGKKVGDNFYKRIIDHMQKEESNFTKLGHKGLINKWLKYDSSSGMGKFELINYKEYPELEIKIEILNCFTTFNSYRLCEWIKGYMEGFLENVYSKKKGKIVVIEEECGPESSDKKCKFKITENIG